MPHQRNRYLKENIEHVLKFSPLVGLLGHRQVGKTTILQGLASDYNTLDDYDTRNTAEQNPKNFVNKLKGHPSAVDECQLIPSLFPAFKERVRINKRPGQIILSGSVRFSSRKAISESLTGRIVNLELLPFSIGEIKHRPLSQSVIELLTTTNLEHFATIKEKEIRNSLILRNEISLYLERGGLPGICFIREDLIREKRISEQISLLLDRDLRLIHNTSLPFHQILDFARYLSNNEGFPLKHSEIQKNLKISDATQKHLLFAMEAIFLIRRLPIEGGRKGFVVYFEDQAEASVLAEEGKDIDQEYEGLIFRNIRVQFFYRLNSKYRFSHFLTRGGARVPIVLKSNDERLGFILLKQDFPTASDRATASSFLRAHGTAKIIYLSLTAKKPNCIDDRSIVLPIEWIL